MKLQDRLQWLEKFDNPQVDKSWKPSNSWSHRTNLLQALKGCTLSRRLSHGRELHALAKHLGLDSDLLVSNSLINLYSKCGCMEEARYVFQNMKHHDVVSWNTLISGYAENGQNNSTAFELFTDMQAQGCTPDSRTYVALLKACTSLAENEDFEPLDESGSVFRATSLEKGMAVHSEARKLGLDRSLYVGTSLVDMYVKCGSLEDATGAFERMVERNVVSWTALLSGYVELGRGSSALELFTLMQRELHGVDSRAVVAALKACNALVTESKLVNLERVMAIHALALENGLGRDLYVGSSLVDVYVKLGRTEEARRVFDEVPVQDVVLWTALLRGYVENGRPEVALEMFSSMIAEGCAPNSQTLVAVLKACSTTAAGEVDGEVTELRSLEVAMALHSEARRRSLEGDIHFLCSLVDVYGKCKCMELAREVFDSIPEHNLVTWNALLLGYVENGEHLTALELFQSMEAAQGVCPDDRTFACMVNACSSLAEKHTSDDSDKLRWLEVGMSLHSRASSTGCQPSIFLTSSLIDMYSNCGSMFDARAVFDDSPSKDTVVWTALIIGYAENSQGGEALRLFTSMEGVGYGRDTRTYAAALKACTTSMSITEGGALHAETCRLGVDLDPVLVNALLDLYGKCGDLPRAQSVFDSVNGRSLSTVTWNILLGGYSHQGDVHRVVWLMEEMVGRGYKPDGVTFVLVLSVCSHAGLVERGREYFLAMGNMYGVEAGREHFHCMVDMLARGNWVEEAVKVAEQMPFKGNAVTWTTVLGACRRWSNAEVGRVAFEKVVELERDKGSAYVLLSNIL